jgi:hypothetical protein
VGVRDVPVEAEGRLYRDVGVVEDGQSWVEEGGRDLGALLRDVDAGEMVWVHLLVSRGEVRHPCRGRDGSRVDASLVRSVEVDRVAIYPHLQEAFREVVHDVEEEDGEEVGDGDDDLVEGIDKLVVGDEGNGASCGGAGEYGCRGCGYHASAHRKCGSFHPLDDGMGSEVS